MPTLNSTEDAPIETLSIPLDNALKRLHKDSTGRSSIGPLIGIAIVPLYLSATNELTQSLQIIFAFMFLIIISICVSKIKTTRSMLKRYNANKQVLILTNKGLKIPLLIIAWFSKLNRETTDSQTGYIYLEWNEIKCWQAVSGKGGNYYYLTINKIINDKFYKNIALPFDNFSKDQQSNILNFAQQFLAHPVQF